MIFEGKIIRAWILKEGDRSAICQVLAQVSGNVNDVKIRGLEISLNMEGAGVKDLLAHYDASNREIKDTTIVHLIGKKIVFDFIE